jgi:hypothetical protein
MITPLRRFRRAIFFFFLPHFLARQAGARAPAMPLTPLAASCQLRQSCWLPDSASAAAIERVMLKRGVVAMLLALKRYDARAAAAAAFHSLRYFAYDDIEILRDYASFARYAIS